MTRERQDITESFYSGNAKTILVNIYDAANELKDLTNAELTYVLFHRTNDTPVYIIKSSYIGEEEIKIVSTGKVEIYIKPSDTLGLCGTFRHHLNVVDKDGIEATVFTGKVEIHNTPALRRRVQSIHSYLEGNTGV